MNLSRDSVTSFSPVDPDHYAVTFKGEAETWTLPVIGFATVITYCATDEGEGTDSGLYPVVLADEGYAITVWEYLHDFGDPKPQWTLHRPRAPRWGTCPACGKAALHMPALDRHLHTDGTDNQDCWRRITRGEV